MGNFSSIGEAVGYYVSQSGLSYNEIYRRGGPHPCSLSKLVHSESRPRSKTLYQLDIIIGLAKGTLEGILQQSLERRRPIDPEELKAINTIGEIFRYCRKINDLYAHDLEKPLGALVRTINHYEAGWRFPSRRFADRFADSFGLDPRVFDRFFDVNYEKARSMQSFGDLLSYLMKIRKISSVDLSDKLCVKGGNIKKAKKCSVPPIKWVYDVPCEKLQAVFSLSEDLFNRFYQLALNQLGEIKEFDSFGLALCYYRKKVADLTLRQVAGRLNRSYECIRQYEKDHLFPDNLTSQDFTTALGLLNDPFYPFFNCDRKELSRRVLDSVQLDTSNRLSPFWDLLRQAAKKQRISFSGLARRCGYASSARNIISRYQRLGLGIPPRLTIEKIVKILRIETEVLRPYYPQSSIDGSNQE